MGVTSPSGEDRAQQLPSLVGGGTILLKGRKGGGGSQKGLQGLETRDVMWGEWSLWKLLVFRVGRMYLCVLVCMCIQAHTWRDDERWEGDQECSSCPGWHRGYNVEGNVGVGGSTPYSCRPPPQNLGTCEGGTFAGL